jgi:O-antigen/teichoic acid export membrane protein
MLRDYYLRIKSSSFAENTFILTLGTFVAQALPLLTYPVLGRLFSPEDFGFLATINVITPILAIFATGMYESAILISASKEEAANIVGMVIVRSLFVLTICYFLMLGFSVQLSNFLKEPILGKWMLIPIIGAFATVIYNSYNEWCVTNKQFVNLSWNKIINTSTVSVGKIGFGVFSMFGNGLALGDLLGKITSAGFCVFRAFRLERNSFKAIKFSRFREVIKKYNNFSRFLMLDQLLNNIGSSIHIFFIVAYFSNAELGFISMSASLLTVPVTVISSAIKDVFRQRAQQEFSENGTCRPTYLKLLKPIAIFGILAFFPGYLLLPQVFSVFFGHQWVKAGEYSQILLPMYLLNFISMSLGGVLVIANKTKVSLYWQIYTIIVTIISLIVGIFVFGNIKETLYCLMVARTSAYFLYMFLSFYYSNKVNG